AAQTRIVSVARIRLDSRESERPFKGIICRDISEFESHMPSHAVRSQWAMSAWQQSAALGDALAKLVKLFRRRSAHPALRMKNGFRHLKPGLFSTNRSALCVPFLR